jgi:5-methylcytosine-specific restriction endonuclease McrA
MQDEGYRGKKRKPCRRCGGEKPPGERRKLCDSCREIAAVEEQEKARQRARDWYAANAERQNERTRRRLASEPEFAAANVARARQWRDDNPQRAAELDTRHRKQWRAENRDRYLELAQRYRARKQAGFIEDVSPLVVLERHDGVCGICGGDVDPFRFDVDHIVPLSEDGEHSYSNTQPAHPRCNYRKGAKVP